MRRLLTPGKLTLAAAALALVVLVLLLVLPASGTYLYLPDDPHLVAPLVEVEGREPRDDGRIYFVDVIVRRPSLFERLFPGVHDGASLVPAEQLNPAGLSEADRRRSSLAVMGRSQQIAAAVALEEAGYEVDAEPTGAVVSQVLPDGPAVRADILPADVIVAVDGERTLTLDELREALDGKRPGTEVRVRVRRGDEESERRLRLGPAQDDPERGVIGVLVEQDVEVELPIDVEIDAGNVGGPSAGLAFALGVLEELGEEADHGHRIAVTGELELDGDVAPVGGIHQKTIGAREGGVDAFLVPAGENAEEARRYADGLRIVPVRNFQQALRTLATLPAADGDG